VAAANIIDPKAHRRGEVMRWHTIPWAVYTAPECAGIGLTEAAAKKQGRKVVTASVPGYMSGRFVAENGLQAPGLAKLILDAETRQVLGIHVLGSYAAEMIWGASAVLAVPNPFHVRSEAIRSRPWSSRGRPEVTPEHPCLRSSSWPEFRRSDLEERCESNRGR